MKLIRLFFFLFFGLMVFNSVFSQRTSTYTNELKTYYQAVNLYQDKAYAAARYVFQDIEDTFPSGSELKANCAYFNANSAIRLGLPEGDALMQDFVDRYPTSTKRNDAFIDVANYYYDIGKYSYALKWFPRVNKENLSNAQMEDFSFRYGYALFASKRYEDSKKLFVNLISSPKYGAQAKYYYGYIAYDEEDYEKADTYLEDASKDKNYKDNVSYYLADINFKLGKFQKAIDQAVPLYESANPKDRSEIAKIIGESYFNLKAYDEAIPYLKEYKGRKGKWNNTDYYLLGYSFYMQGNYTDAAANFNKIVDGKNAVSQNAYYHLAKCYLELDKKSEALNAFRNASQMEFTPEIKEDAWLNYAKLSYEIGNPYQSVPEVLQEYLKEYPSTLEKDRINELITSAYMDAKDYEGALNYLKGKKGTKEKSLYQKVSFYRGVQLFNEGTFKEAKSNFTNAISEPSDEEISARSYFWRAETNYRLNLFQEALSDYQTVESNPAISSLEESRELPYNLGYTYFKLKKYEDALKQFEKYKSTGTDTEKRYDSQMRLADTYFVTSQYQKAIDAYAETLKTTHKTNDYARFQKAVSYGYVGNDSRKEQELNSFIATYKRSAYLDDAYYVLGNLYLKQAKNTKAHSTFDQLISKQSNSPLVPKAMLKKGLMYYNTDQNDLAIATYKKIVASYPSAPEARQAVKNTRQIYVDIGEVETYADWVKTLDFIEVSDGELDNDTYEAADKQYIENNYRKAIPAFKKYLQSFPKGIHVLKANFYLAQCLYSEDKATQSIPYLEYVIAQPSNDFTETALARLSEIYLMDKNWEQAMPVLQRLETEGQVSQNTIYATSNMMKGYYELENYSQAVVYAEKILQDTSIDSKVSSDAQIIIARSAIKEENFDKARAAYSQVATIATGVFKAEALYYEAYFKNQEKQYDASNAVIQTIVSQYSSYRYWGAKSLIVMAQNQYALEDAFQATYILESVIKNFADFEEVVEEATLELNAIKKEAAKTNDSIDTDE